MVAIAALGWLVLGGMRDPDPTRRRWGWAAFFGVVYFGTHQLLDFYANMPAILFAFAIPIAWLDATAPRVLAAPAAGVRASGDPWCVRCPAQRPSRFSSCQPSGSLPRNARRPP